MRNRIFAPLALTALAVSSCTYGDRASFETEKRNQTNPDSIEVVETRSCSRQYKVIGNVSAESYYMSSALKRCRKEAAALGADALLDFGPSGNQTGMATFSAGMAVGSSYNTGWTAKAIVWAGR